eukprot:CAMPEP_0115229248 /NCGR_PEP_ID=MMETSP0270-20121206/32092_1 /TAXON_ID=71861 /ORGANISM="Scrippsiella trochoidea, Strain CCMP3099" /LENGTH=150 /DNA_ID=CAMNT_0002643783 /DNA_START=85 /DNA_END=537 /DNA_ORIENTATION=+
MAREIMIVAAMLVLAGAAPTGIVQGSSLSNACAPDDLMCYCKEACDEPCAHYNISSRFEAVTCATCMATKCARQAVKMCKNETSWICGNCITRGGVCWMTQWPTCFGECLRVWSPMKCPECWLENYTAHCVHEYDKCWNVTADHESELVV